MKQFLRIKFSRPINPDKDYITFGGLECKLNNGDSFLVDFADYEGKVDENDPSVLNAEMENEDVTVYDESSWDFIPVPSGMHGHLTKITAVNELCVYISGDEADTLKPVKILEWKVQDSPSAAEQPTDLVTFEDGPDNDTRTYTFADDVFNNANFVVEEG